MIPKSHEEAAPRVHFDDVERTSPIRKSPVR
jgi:hypothetical protein